MALPDTRRLEDLAIEPLSELCKEAYEETARAFDNTLKKAVHFGRLLCIAKTKVPHGQWIPWVTETLEDQVSLRHIQRFMQVAESNTTDPSLLEGAKHLDEAMGLIRVKKTSVEVIEVAASIPEVAAELPPPQSFCATTEPAVATSTPVVAKPASPPRHLGEHNESEVFALTKADVAITQLNGIPMKNKFRDAALDRVLSWIDSERTQKCKKPTTSENQ